MWWWEPELAERFASGTIEAVASRIGDIAVQRLNPANEDRNVRLVRIVSGPIQRCP
jgi:hypothetical protein